ncbi:Predicted outer membrane protein [Mycobacterium tuberculosis]|nr:Predicted outer membrane protein [Mycobacterium tuberculosis]
MVEELRTRVGVEFDIAYANAMVESHSKALVILDQEVGKLGNEKLKTFAEKTSKVISEHLENARDLQRTVR